MPSDSHTNTVNFRPICRSTQNAARGAIFLRIADWETKRGSKSIIWKKDRKSEIAIRNALPFYKAYRKL